VGIGTIAQVVNPMRLTPKESLWDNDGKWRKAEKEKKGKDRNALIF
jgi:hypothetical protein